MLQVQGLTSNVVFLLDEYEPSLPTKAKDSGQPVVSFYRCCLSGFGRAGLLT